MNRLFDIDVHALRGSLLFTTGILVLASLLVGASMQFRRVMDDEKLLQEKKVQEVSLQYRELVKAERIIDTLYGRYQALEQQGFIGEEPRLQWLEALRSAGDKSGIIAIQYRLHEQHPVAGVQSLNSDPYQLYVSTMDLQVDALHEGDLLIFLDRLNKIKRGVLSVDGCTLKDQSGEGALLNVANVHAECKLSWYTIRPQADTNNSGEFM